MLPITSLQNPRVKEAVRLRDPRHRRKQRRIVIDGARELLRAVNAGLAMLEVFVCESLCKGDDAGQLLSILDRGGSELFSVSEAIFEKLAFGHRTEGVLAVAEMPQPTLDSLTLGQNPLVAVLEAVEKPGNVGAVLRSADAAGVSAVIVTDSGTDLYNPNAIRASLGTIFTMQVCEATSAAARTWLRERDFAVVAARVDGAVPYTEVDLRGPTAIVLGSEAKGLSPTWTDEGIQAVRLPMLGVADSLNVSVTAAVLFYEALRQRNPHGMTE
jgi:RNA methyltransferase, TrmH family